MSGKKNENIVDLFYKNSSVFAEIYSETCKTSKMETFSKIAPKNAFGCLTGLWLCLCIAKTCCFLKKIFIFFKKKSESETKSD